MTKRKQPNELMLVVLEKPMDDADLRKIKEKLSINNTHVEAEFGHTAFLVRGNPRITQAHFGHDNVYRRCQTARRRRLSETKPGLHMVIGVWESAMTEPKPMTSAEARAVADSIRAGGKSTVLM